MPIAIRPHGPISRRCDPFAAVCRRCCKITQVGVLSSEENEPEISSSASRQRRHGLRLLEAPRAHTRGIEKRGTYKQTQADEFDRRGFRHRHECRGIDFKMEYSTGRENVERAEYCGGPVVVEASGGSPTMGQSGGVCWRSKSGLVCACLDMFLTGIYQHA